MKISEYLREIQNYSSRSLRRVLVYLDNKQVRLTKKLPSSGTLKVVEKEKETNIKPIQMELDIVYEDQDLLIINKPYGLVTHPTLKKVDVTLANGVVYYLNTVPRFYNRLDMDTTGLIIVAKNSYTQSFLQNYGNVRKKYLAIVEGKLEKETII
ncbi:pseudouridine synthase, partial [uncultured Sneathia sp.]